MLNSFVHIDQASLAGVLFGECGFVSVPRLVTDIGLVCREGRYLYEKDIALSHLLIIDECLHHRTGIHDVQL